MARLQVTLSLAEALPNVLGHYLMLIGVAIAGHYTHKMILWQAVLASILIGFIVYIPGYAIGLLIESLLADKTSRM